jgi:hypothetical protein
MIVSPCGRWQRRSTAYIGGRSAAGQRQVGYRVFYFYGDGSGGKSIRKFLVVCSFLFVVSIVLC